MSDKKIKNGYQSKYMQLKPKFKTLEKENGRLKNRIGDLKKDTNFWKWLYFGAIGIDVLLIIFNYLGVF